MHLELNPTVEHVFILGAGASADYGLPVWKDLSLLIKEKIQNPLYNAPYGEEILAWLGKVGKNKEYSTLDECISKESISNQYPEGDEIEDQIFRLMKEIFGERYNQDQAGWIRKLNEKILHNRNDNLERRIAFINFNYDRVLDDLLLDYSYLHKKLRRNNHRIKLARLKDAKIDVLYPHGNLYREKDFTTPRYTNRHIRTMKTHDKSQMDAVSCYESHGHTLSKRNLVSGLELHILGLGGGLEINLNNLTFENPVSGIHITSPNDTFARTAIDFLGKKFNLTGDKIELYPKSCDALIEKALNSI